MTRELRGRHWRAGLGLCLLCAVALLWACGGGPGLDPNAGPPPVGLNIPAFSYAPPSPIRIGDTLTFTARILEPQVVSVQVLANGESHGELRVELRDDGVAPDAAAGDFTYTGAAVWTPALGPGVMAVSLTVTALVNGNLVSANRLSPWLHVAP